MTGTKTISIDQSELPGVDDITLDVDWLYEYKAADAVSGEEVDCKITLPEGWESTVLIAYLKAGREAIRRIELDIIPDMEFDSKPKQWAQEDINNQ